MLEINDKKLDCNAVFQKSMTLDEFPFGLETWLARTSHISKGSTTDAPISRVAQGAYLEVEYIRNALSVSGTLKYADSGTA